jgi:hypothetical protein
MEQKVDYTLCSIGKNKYREAHATWSSEGLMKYLADGEVDEIIIILPDNREIKMVRK